MRSPASPFNIRNTHQACQAPIHQNQTEAETSMLTKIPRDKTNDYTRDMAQTRRNLVTEHTGSELNHVGSYSFDPAILPGNIENFTGVAQIPMGLAGPILINGEHAQGEFYVPIDRKSVV